MTKPLLMYVVDASVVVKWFSQLDEDNLETALSLRDAYAQGNCLLIAPDLMLYEVVNALRHNPQLKEEDTQSAFESLVKMDLAVSSPREPDLRRVISYSYERGLSIYDAVYLALADEYYCPLITADQKFYQKVDDLPQVIHLPALGLHPS
jgi:predicted nucleic acid-binding protein